MAILDSDGFIERLIMYVRPSKTCDTMILYKGLEVFCMF